MNIKIIYKLGIIVSTLVVSIPTRYYMILFFLFVGCDANRKLIKANFREDLLNKRFVKSINFKEEFTITHKTPKSKKNIPYVWFRNGKLHISNGAYEGFLVDGTYTKFNVSGGLLEKGVLKKGVKRGRWTIWHQNGEKAILTNYKRGKKSGKFFSLDTLGFVLISGRFKNGLKHGKWINLVAKDTLLYNKGILIKKDTVSETQRSFLLKRLFKKIKKDSVVTKSKNKGIRKEQSKSNSKRNLKNKKVSPDSKSFFKRLFNRNTKNK